MTIPNHSIPVPDWATANQATLVAALAELRQRLDGRPGEGRDGAPGAVPAAGASALDRLRDAFELSSFERDLVLLCAGVELDGAFAAAVSSLPGASHPGGRPTFALALAALPDGAHWSALAPSSALRYWHLIMPALRADEPLTAAPLRIDERILHFLTGVIGLDERLAGVVVPVPGIADPLPASQRRTAEGVVRLWRRQPAGLRWPAVCLCGPDPAARRAVAAAVAAELGMPLLALDGRDIPGAAGERETLARLWEREAVLAGAALLVEAEAGDEMAEAERRRVVAAFVGRTQGALFVSAHDAPPAVATPPVPVRVDVPVPPAAEQEAAWRAVLGPAAADLNGQIGALAAQFTLDGGAIRGAAAAATAAADPDGDLGQAVWDACRGQARPSLDDLAQRIASPAGWDDLVLPAAEVDTLRQIAAAARQRTRVYEEWGFAAKVGAHGLGLSALFAGPSGTGKTMAAEVLANDLRLDLYRVDLAGVVSKYIGETEKNLRRIFQAAEHGGAVLLFDEADALFGKRSEVKDSHDRYANIEVSYLLQRMEAYRGLAILTTNMRDALDPAFLRRLRFAVNFPFPEAAERERIWRKVFPAATPTGGLDWPRLAAMNVAGGSIRNIALGAAFLAADEREPVGMAHVRRAAIREYAKLEQGMTASEMAAGPGEGEGGPP